MLTQRSKIRADHQLKLRCNPWINCNDWIYIPAFYGAFSEYTAVAEIRPGIGEEVAIGEFVLQRDVKVFDFTVFSRAPHDRWSDIYAHTRFDFIRQMEDEIGRRVLPYEKQRQYISTQIVAEYVKEYFGCEAVICRSSMIRDRSAENRNIVFLPRAESFVGGDTAVLRYERYDVKEVMDVTHELARSPVLAQSIWGSCGPVGAAGFEPATPRPLRGAQLAPMSGSYSRDNGFDRWLSGPSDFPHKFPLCGTRDSCLTHLVVRKRKGFESHEPAGWEPVYRTDVSPRGEES